MKLILSIIEKISLSLGYVSGGLVVLMMLSIVIDVFMRHVLNQPTIWADEISCYLLVGITFLGAAYTLMLDGHIRVEAILTRFNPKIRKHIEIVAEFFSLIFLFIFSWQAFKLVIDSYTSVRIAPTLLRTPLYIPQFLFAFGLLWFFLQLLAKILRRRTRQSLEE
jgi:TRAP-type C4-dicarboxylate transport system permease small subunit